MKSGRPLVLVVNRGGTLKHGCTVKSGGTVKHGGTVKSGPVKSGPANRGAAPGRVRQPLHLRLVPAEGLSASSLASAAGAAERAPAPARRASAAQQRPRSLSRPLGQRVAQAANDLAVLALALLSGLYPRA